MTETVDPQTDGPMTWGIGPIRSPNRFEITCTCRHGTVREYLATNGSAPVASLLVPTTARNANRKFACACYLSPAP